MQDSQNRVSINAMQKYCCITNSGEVLIAKELSWMSEQHSQMNLQIPLLTHKGILVYAIHVCETRQLVVIGVRKHTVAL